MTKWSLVGHFLITDKITHKTKTPPNRWYDSACRYVPGAIRTPDRRLRRTFALIFTVFNIFYSAIKYC